MTSHVAFWLGPPLCALAAVGCVYQFAALVALRRLFARPRARADVRAGVTILKPLHGAEPRLEQNLASFLDQQVAAPVQMVCGVGDPADPAAAAVAQLQAARADADIALSVGRAPAANAKVGNLAAMTRLARHEVFVLSDSDIAVAPDYLAAVLAALAQPGIGAVSCLYRGRADAGVWSRLSAGAISYLTLPAFALGYVAGLARPCMGSTIALARETLARIGGFEAFADVLADDYAIGAAIAALGLTVAIPPLLVVHGCAEASFAALWRQKRRWAATIRGIAPLRHLGSIVTYPLPLALLGAPFAPLPALALAALSLALRLATAATVDRIAGARSAPRHLLPAIEIVEFAAFVASCFGREADWRGSRLALRRGGRIAA